MDVVLDWADNYVLDDVYSKIPLTAEWSRDFWVRQSVSLVSIVAFYGYIFYLSFAGFSYLAYFDKTQMKHPKFLKNQVRQEIFMSLEGILPISIMTLPWFLGEVRGHSRLYSDISEYGWPYLAFSVFFFLFFTDMMIYWIHRWLHHPILYGRIHKPHHRWIVPTPFASHAFHPLDGYLQSLPYHIFVYIFPMNKFLYLGMYLFVNAWTVAIHDGEYLTQNPLINGAANHTVHHVYFNYNYGQYFTLWDRIGGSFRQPSEEQYDRSLKNSAETRRKQAKCVEEILKDPLMRDDKSIFLGLKEQ